MTGLKSSRISERFIDQNTQFDEHKRKYSMCLSANWGHLELYHSLSSGQRHARSRSLQPLTLAISPVVIDACLAWVREDQSKVFTDDHYLLIEQIRVISAALKFGFETFYPGVKVLQLQLLEFRFCFVSN